MKSILTLLLLSLSTFLFAQDDKNLGKHFLMKQNFLAQKCDAVGNNLITTNDALQRTFVVVVEAIGKDGYVVSVPEFTKTTELNKTYAKMDAVGEQKDANGKIITPAQPPSKIYFLIPFDQFDKVCVKPTSRHSFTVGIPTIPAKLRFGNGGQGTDPRYFRFEGNLSLGLSGGWKYSFGEDEQFGFNVLAGFTVASVAVDSLTTKGRVSSNTTAASFSPHLGLVFDFQKFQFGLYTGIDFLYGELNKYWVYRNQPWLGIGIGYSLFRAGGQTENK